MTISEWPFISHFGEGGAKFSVDVAFLPTSRLNVLILKEVTKNIHENQQAKSWAC